MDESNAMATVVMKALAEKLGVELKVDGAYYVVEVLQIRDAENGLMPRISFIVHRKLADGDSFYMNLDITPDSYGVTSDTMGEKAHHRSVHNTGADGTMEIEVLTMRCVRCERPMSKHRTKLCINCRDGEAFEREAAHRLLLEKENEDE